MRTSILIALNLFIIASCHSEKETHNTTDEMCIELSKFSNSSTWESKNFVDFSTDGSLMERACSYEEKGRNFCTWLSENTSIEFPVLNISRVLSCLNETESFTPSKFYEVEYMNGKISSFNGKLFEENVFIELEYSINETNSISNIKITSTRKQE